MELNTIHLSSVQLNNVYLNNRGGVNGEKKLYLLDIDDEEVRSWVISQGIKPNKLGLFSSEDTGKITTFDGYFRANQNVDHIDALWFPSVEEIDLRDTMASMLFTSYDDDETVPQKEIEEYLNSL